MNPDLAIAWIPCDELGCENGLVVDARHRDNFDRDWYCLQHRETSR